MVWDNPWNMQYGCQGLSDVSSYKPVPVVLAKQREQKPICTIDLYHEDLGLHVDQVGNLMQN